MWRGGASAQTRVEALISDLESFLEDIQQANALYHNTLVSNKPELAESVLEHFLEGCSREVYKRLVHSTLQYIT